MYHFVLGSLCSEDESRIIITAPHTTAMEYFTQREGLYGMVAGANVSNWIFPGKECHNTNDCFRNLITIILVFLQGK